MRRPNPLSPAEPYRRDRPYTSEATLCADFIAWASIDGWVSYAETAGWDILMVRGGVQIGVQAKLSFNATLLRQVLPVDGSWMNWQGIREAGPDYRAVLHGRHDDDARQACDAIGLIYWSPLWTRRFPDHNPKTAEFRPGTEIIARMPQWNPERRLDLPAYIPDVVAGASCPIQLTQWKIGALRLIARLEIRGYVTRGDFGQVGIDHRRWTGPGSRWLQPRKSAGGLPAPGEFVAGRQAPPFAAQHPTTYLTILAETRDQLEKEAPR